MGLRTHTTARRKVQPAIACTWTAPTTVRTARLQKIRLDREQRAAAPVAMLVGRVHRAARGFPCPQHHRQSITASHRRPFGQIASTVKSHRRVERLAYSHISIPANAPAMPVGREQRAARELPRPRHHQRQHVHRTFQHRRHPPLAQPHTTASHTLAGPQSTLDAGMVWHGYGPRSHRAVLVVDAAAAIRGLHKHREKIE